MDGSNLVKDREVAGDGSGGCNLLTLVSGLFLLVDFFVLVINWHSFRFSRTK